MNAETPIAIEYSPRRCPQCGNSVIESERRFLPFCSRRCQQLDLAAWLDERIGMPYESDQEPGHPPGSESND